MPVSDKEYIKTLKQIKGIRTILESHGVPITDLDALALEDLPPARASCSENRSAKPMSGEAAAGSAGALLTSLKSVRNIRQVIPPALARHIARHVLENGASNLHNREHPRPTRSCSACSR